MARAARPAKEVVVEKDGNIVRLKIPTSLAATLRGRARRHPVNYRPFDLPSHPPNVKPAGSLAMDADPIVGEVISWAASNIVNSAYAEGQVFLGYAQLSILAQRPEFRKVTETIATEATRQWITLRTKGDDDKADKIGRLYELIKNYKLQHVCRKAVEGDGFFGRGHIYIALRDERGSEVEAPDELVHSIGNGRDKISKEKVKKGALLGFRNVEAVWCYPSDYNSSNPLSVDWYKPRMWHAMGVSLDRTRLLTIVSREVPDIIKPAYSFGGLSLTQMVKPYVDNFLRTRQSVSDLVHSFSVSGIKTNLQSLLTPGGDDLLTRIDFFNATRDNAGAMLLDKDTEEWFNVTTPLSTLDALQSQSQEQIASVAGIPIVKLLGIQPQGLNASSEGEIRTFYDGIHALQENVLRGPLETMLDFIQLSEWGEVDPEITVDFNPLWQLDEAGKLGIEKTKTDIDDANIAMGAVSPEEVRQRLAKDPQSIYHGLDLSEPLPDPDPVDDLGGGMDPNDPHEENSDVPKPRDPSDRLSSVTSRAALKGIGSGDAEFEENKHPRDESGKFGSGGHLDIGSVNPKEMPEGNVKQTTMPFPGDKHVAEVLKAAKEADPDWKYDISDYPSQEVSKDKIVSIQPWEDPKTVAKYREEYRESGGFKKGAGSDHTPLAFKHDGRFYILSGNHRTSAALQEGAKTVKMRVFGDKGGSANDLAIFSKLDVRYECPAKGEDHCGECQHFRGPAACELVAGAIDAEGWCEEFEEPEEDLASDAEWAEADHERDAEGKFAAINSASFPAKGNAMRKLLSEKGFTKVGTKSGGIEYKHENGTRVIRKPSGHWISFRPGFSAKFGNNAAELSKLLSGTPKAPSSSSIVNIGKLEKIGPQLGSNPGGQFKDKDGNKFYVKNTQSPDHAANEMLAAALYKAAGSGTLDYKKSNDPSAVVTEFKPLAAKNVSELTPSQKKQAQQDFAVHAWLANWDAVGLSGDNLGSVEPGGKPINLDLGGSLLYRAKGGAKGSSFGTEANEWDSLRDPAKNPQSAALFKDMTPEDLEKSKEKVKAVTPEMIEEIVKQSGLSGPEKAYLAETLEARRQDILARPTAAPSKPKDPDEHRREIAKMMPARTKKVSDAILDYKGSGYYEMNNCTRFLVGCDDPRVEAIQEYLDKAELPETTLYRGVKSDYAERVIPFLQKAATGKPKVLHDAGFASTATMESFSKSWAGGQGLLLEIKVPAGSKGAAVRPADQGDSEFEILLQRDSRYIVESYDHKNRKVVVRLDQSHLS